MVSLFSSRSSPRCKLLLLTTSSPPDQGFTMFEVLVALMMSFLFLTGTLNAMVVSAIFQVKAERQAQASYWIQEDLENVRADAASFLDSDADCDSNTEGADYIALGTSAPGDGIPPVLGDDPTVGTVSTNTKEIVNKTYTLYRTLATASDVATLQYCVSDDAVNCDNDDTNNTADPLATLYTEILPASALNCSP